MNLERGHDLASKIEKKEKKSESLRHVEFLDSGRAAASDSVDVQQRDSIFFSVPLLPSSQSSNRTSCPICAMADSDIDVDGIIAKLLEGTLFHDLVDLLLFCFFDFSLLKHRQYSKM